MGHVESRLRRLTHVFIAWFVAQSILQFDAQVRNAFPAATS